MDRKDERSDKSLPVTAEVGDEGGSYADSTLQVDTFTGPFGNDRVDQQVVAGVAGEAAAVPAEGEQRHESGDEFRHATEDVERKP